MPERRSRAILAVILLVAGVRVASTWPMFSETIDESSHVATGMEWLEKGVYNGEPQHPPLARVATAIGPYLAGIRLSPEVWNYADEGTELLHRGPYVRILSLARAGILPFFLLSIVVVWAYARFLAGDVAATLAALLYSNLPPVLAHAGLATTDMAATAGIAASLFFLTRCLSNPSRWNAILLGLATAVAVTSKFSALLFLPVAGLVIIAVTFRRDRRLVSCALIAAATCLLSMWAVFRFTFEPLTGGHHDLVRLWVESKPSLSAIAPHIRRIALPMPQLFSGIAQMLLHNAAGHSAYLLGELRSTGWWSYFPIAIAVKTPIVFLLLALLSPLLLLRRGRTLLAPFLAALAIVVACFPVSINIGIRHVLPIYPLLAVSAACALASLWPARRAAIAGLLLIELFVSLRAHPDYLAYFNAFAGKEPGRILVDSNLDWGQDLLRLERVARDRKIDAVQLSYFGSADVEQHALPVVLPLDVAQPSPGWVAVSETNAQFFRANHPWIDRQPYERIGRSIRLYRIPGPIPPAARREVLSKLSRIVVPLPIGSSAGADGKIWETRLVVRNDGDSAETVVDRGGIRLDVPPRSSVPWAAAAERSAWFLYVRPRAKIRATVEVRATKDGRLKEELTAIDAPRETAFHARATLPPNAGCAGCARTLRVYNLDSGPAGVDIIARAGSRRWSHFTFMSNKPGAPSWVELDVARTFPEAGLEPVRFEIVSTQRQPVWGLLTVRGERQEVVTSE